MTAYRFERLKVLVVDDSVHMRKLIVTILQAFGVDHVCEADSGECAWAILADTNPDIVLLDWMMDGLSGLDLVRLIRGHHASPNPFVPVIMLTGHSSQTFVGRARDAGVNEFIAKPVSIKTLMSRLVTVIEHPRPYVRTGHYFGPCRRRRESEPYQGSERRQAFDRQAAE